MGRNQQKNANKDKEKEGARWLKPQCPFCETEVPEKPWKTLGKSEEGEYESYEIIQCQKCKEKGELTWYSCDSTEELDDWDQAIKIIRTVLDQDEVFQHPDDSQIDIRIVHCYDMELHRVDSDFYEEDNPPNERGHLIFVRRWNFRELWKRDQACQNKNYEPG